MEAKIFSPGEGRTHNPGMALQVYCSISTVRCRLRHWGTRTLASPIWSYEQLRHFYSVACISSLSFYLWLTFLSSHSPFSLSLSLSLSPSRSHTLLSSFQLFQSWSHRCHVGCRSCSYFDLSERNIITKRFWVTSRLYLRSILSNFWTFWLVKNYFLYFSATREKPLVESALRPIF